MFDIACSFTSYFSKLVSHTDGSLNHTGVSALKNDYLVFDQNMPVTLARCVSNGSVKYCSLPRTVVTSTSAAIQRYTLPAYQLNISIAEYVGIEFGLINGGSPYRVLPSNSSYTAVFGGVKSNIFTRHSRLIGVYFSISFTGLTRTKALLSRLSEGKVVRFDSCQMKTHVIVTERRLPFLSSSM